MMIQNTGALSRLNKSDILKYNPIYLDTFICKTVYTPDIAFSQLYTHQIIEICMIVSGNGVHRVLDQVIPCKEGDLYVTSPDVPHGFFVGESGQEMTVRRMMFDVSDWFDGEIAEQGDPRYLYGVFSDSAVVAYAMLNSRTQNEIEELYISIAAEMTDKKHEWRETIKAYLSLFLITVGRYVNRAIKNIPSVPPKEWGLVSPAIRMMSEHLGEETLTLEFISDALFISKSHLSRLFKKYTGESFSNYLRNLRLSHACRLLKETTLTVEEIVKQCGLRDMPSFYRMFHVHMDMTPNQYRTVQTTDKLPNKNKDKITSIFNQISENLQKGRSKVVKELVKEALDSGCTPSDVLNKGLLAGLNVVGEKFKNNEVYVPEVLVAARTLNIGAQMLKPYLATENVATKGKVCLGTVQGDLHDIGKNLVKMMMESKGLEVIDLGVDVPPQVFVQTAVEQNCQVIACSALLTTTRGVMGDVVKAAEKAGVRDKILIMIGGAPTSEEFCKLIGADKYTEDAASAAEVAVEFCQK